MTLLSKMALGHDAEELGEVSQASCDVFPRTGKVSLQLMRWVVNESAMH